MASGVWAQRVGDLQASSYAPTVAGVNAALAYCSVGGGTVLVDSGAAIPIVTTSIKIPNRVRLLGIGDHTATGTFVCGAATNVTSVIENLSQDGTQQYAYLEHISIDGNKASGAVVGSAITFKCVFVGSRIKDTLVYNSPGYGVTFDGGTAVGAGQMIFDNLTVTSSTQDNILITGPVDGFFGYQITAENAAAGKAQVRITLGASAGGASFGHYIFGLHMEGVTGGADGLVLDRCSNCLIDGITWDGTATANNLVKITGTSAGSDGAFGASGHVIRNAYANLTTIIDDQTAGVTVGNAQGRFVTHYSSPSASSGAVNHQVVGLQAQHQGQNITAAASISPGNGNLFTVDGNTGITAITTAARDKGRIICLRFSGSPTVTDGGNLKLNGSLNATATDTLTLISDGTNWYEIGRANAGGDVTLVGTLYQLASSVASATDVTLPSGNFISITGSTTVNKLLPVTSGRVVYIRFSASITIQDLSAAAGNIGLAGGVNFYAVDKDSLTLVSDGTTWTELSRKTFRFGQGPNIASAATIAIPGYGDVFHVTGNTNITNGITVNAIDSGRTVVLIFDSTPTITDTGTSRLAGNFVATADDTLTLKCDGTNWFELGRSIN